MDARGYLGMDSYKVVNGHNKTLKNFSVLLHSTNKIAFTINFRYAPLRFKCILLF